MWCGRARVPGTRGHGATRAACRRRPPRRRAVGHVSAGLATHGAHREPGPGWAPRMDVGAGGGRRVSCSRRVTFGSRAAHHGLPRGRPGLWSCVSLPARLLGLLRGARGLGVHGQGSRPPGGQARQRGASRGGSRVVAGADEDAGLCCGLVGPRVQRVGALLTPEAAPVVQPPVCQVPLHEVHVLPADATGAADGADRSLASLPLDGGVCADRRQRLPPGWGGRRPGRLGRGLLSRWFLTGVRQGPLHAGHAPNGGAPVEVVVVLGHVGQDAQPVGHLQGHHVLGVQQGRDAQLLLSHVEGQFVVLVNVFLPEGIEVSLRRPVRCSWKQALGGQLRLGCFPLGSSRAWWVTGGRRPGVEGLLWAELHAAHRSGRAGPSLHFLAPTTCCTCMRRCCAQLLKNTNSHPRAPSMPASHR